MRNGFLFRARRYAKQPAIRPAEYGIVRPVRRGCAVLRSLHTDRQIVIEALGQEEQIVSSRGKGIVHEEQMRSPGQRRLYALQFRDHFPGGNLRGGESL